MFSDPRELLRLKVGREDGREVGWGPQGMVLFGFGRFYFSPLFLSPGHMVVSSRSTKVKEVVPNDDGG